MASSSATAMLAAGIAALFVLSLSVPHVAAARALGVVEWPCCRQYDAPPTVVTADVEAQEERPRGPPVDPLQPYGAPPPPHVKAPVPAAQPPRPRGPPVDPLPHPYLAPPPPRAQVKAPVPAAQPRRPSYRGPPVDPLQPYLAPPPPVKVAPVPAVQPPSPIRVPYPPFPAQLEAAADSETTDNVEPEWPCCRQYDAPPTV